METEIHTPELLGNHYDNKDIQGYNKGYGDTNMGNNNKTYQSFFNNCNKILPKNKQTRLSQNTNANSKLTQSLSVENISIPIEIDNLGQDKHISHKYDDLTIPRMIRKQERQYKTYLKQNKTGTHNKYILDYKTNLFTNRLFYNISSKQLTQHEEHLLALGLKFTIDNHQATDNELLAYIEEYHRRLCVKYDTVNILKHTTEEPTQEIQLIKGYVKHLKYKIQDLYKNEDIRLINTDITQQQEPAQCHNSIDNIAIKKYIKKCNLRITKLLNTHPFQNFILKHNKIKRAIYNLKNDPTIIIKPADKNLGLVIMDTTTYIEAGEDKLKKTNNYQLVKTEIQYEPILKELIDIFIEAQMLNVKDAKIAIKYTLPMDWTQFRENQYTPLLKLLLFYFDHPKMIRICRLYLLPKIHKHPLSWREICSSPGWITFIISMFIDLILQPLLTKVPTYIQDSSSFIRETQNICMEHEYAFLQADVEALYPSIHIDDGLASLHQTLLKANIEPTMRTLIIRLTKWVLKNNYMTFNNKTYLQINGTAIGTPLAVTYAGLFMADIETRALNQIKRYKLPEPIIYKRLMDDLASIHVNKENAEYFIKTLQEVLPEQIKFTYEISETECIFLDLTLYKHRKQNGTYKLATKLFQKKMNKYLFIPPFSNHAPHIHRGWITSYIKRIRLNCTQDIHFLLHKNTFFLRLLVRGYDIEFLTPIFAQRFHRTRLIKRLLQKKNEIPIDSQTASNIIFKLPTCSRTCQLKTELKKCLRFTRAIKSIRNKSKIIGQSQKAPILCYKGGKKLGSILVKAQITK